MGWQGTKMLTNGEHDELWREGAYAIQNLKCLAPIANSLKRANGVTILKELYSLGEISKEDYIDGLKQLMTSEGFKITED